MGLFKDKYPIKVRIYRRYDNTIAEVDEKAAYFRLRHETSDGIVDEDFLELKSSKKRIPPIDIKHYYNFEEMARTKSYRKIFLLELDADTFYPLKWDTNGLVGWVKVPVMDEKTKQPLVGEDGKPVTEMKETVMLDLSMAMTKNNEIISMPQAAVVSTYDKEQWVTLQINRHNAMFKSRSSLKEWLPIIVMFLGVGGIIVVSWLFYSNFTKQVELVTSSNREIVTLGRDVLETSMKILNATVKSASLSNGGSANVPSSGAVAQGTPIV